MRLKQGVRVLALKRGSIQVGVAPGVVLEGLTRAQRGFVESLEGGREIRTPARADIAILIEKLAACGLTEPAAPPRRIVAIDDAGPVGTQIARLLGAEGWTLAVDDPRPAVTSRRASKPALPDGFTSAQALNRTLREAGVAVASPSSRADLTIITGHGALAVHKSIGLMPVDASHVYVTTDESGAWVGPLVIPGEAACGLCASLWRADHDANWPILALQLTAPGTGHPLASPAIASAIAALVALIAHAVRAGDAAHMMGRQWRVDATGISPASLQPHPDCGCGAQPPAGVPVIGSVRRSPGSVPRTR